MMLLSSLTMFTSSMPGMVFTPSLFRVFCKRLSSVDVVLCTAFFFLRVHDPISHGASTHARAVTDQRSSGRVAKRAALLSISATDLRTVPLPPVLTAEAIFISLSRSIAAACHPAEAC